MRIEVLADSRRGYDSRKRNHRFADMERRMRPGARLASLRTADMAISSKFIESGAISVLIAANRIAEKDFK
jgi:hypothetical protein